MSKDNLESKIFKYNDIISYQDGSIVSKIILSKDVGTVTLFAFDKDQKISTHTTPYQALLQIIEGTCQVTIDKKEFNLSALDSIILPANVPHAVFAIGKFKMVLTMIKSK
ncbi:MAG: hypothetical protein K1060chlam5_00903 [Candidatus Anoxychlamydiales bacterium]|nr:hypothetical protein [Candidatus Anoxychlamydiales bacterium]